MKGEAVVPADADVIVSVTSPLWHRCPYRDESDIGTVEISWRVDGATFELHELRAYLVRFAESEVSHEALTDIIRHDLSAIPGIADVTVTTTWNTAGMEVRCSTWQTPVAQA